MSRKYKQAGYQDQGGKSQLRRHSGAKLKRDGPRSPRMPGFQEVVRCATCGTKLPAGLSEVSTSTQCPKCKAALHTCRNCTYLDPGSRFECTQPISKRVVSKNIKNNGEFFQSRTTVEKITTSGAEKPADARQAFENLFKE